MALPVSNRPQGLLSLLGSKSLGDAPRLFSDQYLGVIDCGELLLLGERETVTFAPIAPVLGSNTFAEPVPQNEIWYLWHYTVAVAVALPAAAVVRLRPTVQFQTANMPIGDQVSAVTGEVFRTYLPQRVLVNSGALFGFFVESLSGAPGNFNAAAVITRLRV